LPFAIKGVTGDGRPLSFARHLPSSRETSGELGGSSASLLGAGVKLELEPLLTAADLKASVFAALTLGELLVGRLGRPPGFFEKKPRMDF
jgi:hypothetical protein